LLFGPTSCHGKPVHRDDPGIVCPAGNPRGSVRGGEDDRGVAVVVHPRLVAKPIVGHDRSVSRRLNRSCWLYPMAIGIFIWSHCVRLTVVVRSKIVPNFVTEAIVASGTIFCGD